MSVKEGTVSPTGLTVLFENNSGKLCIYGEYFVLQKRIDGKWYQVPVIIDENYGFDAIGYDLASEEIREWEVDWEWLYGSLDIGEYRIIKDVLDFRSIGDYDKHYLMAEFTIDLQGSMPNDKAQTEERKRIDLYIAVIKAAFQ